MKNAVIQYVVYGLTFTTVASTLLLFGGAEITIALVAWFFCVGCFYQSIKVLYSSLFDWMIS